MKALITVLILLWIHIAFGQRIENLKSTFENGLVTVQYDLIGGSPKQLYNVTLYSSHNNYSTPLRKVSGDVGENIRGGNLREIVWNAKEELGKYKGEVSFKVKTEVLPLPFQFLNPAAGKSIRRGKTSALSWEGGNATKNVKLELYKGSEKVTSIADTKNTGQYDLSIPIDFEKGDDYTLRISDGRQTATSNMFSVKAKIPLMLKLSPLLIGAAIIPFMGGSGGGDTPTASEKLAAAPNPN